jgi:phosphoribosylformylglycinamidine synthase II
MENPEITDDLIAAHGLAPDEYAEILRLLNRPPTLTEIGIFSAMWNEHCSYKSSKRWLRLLPSDGPQVICGPGENAGVVDIGDGLAVVFKMESHNHPSYIEPYQGAATGMGGILRDVFTMGARPVAAMNSLSFGAPDHPRTRSLVAGVVAGIGGYGNCFGVPTIGGEVRFHPAYNGNCLVNAFAAGIARADRIFYSAASGVGRPVVYLGAKTGRDGVGGATMASAEFDDTLEEKRPTVQVGDPFTEKRLLEACLELMDSGAVISIQDMGAAGLTCSAVEMGDKGGLGIALDLDLVPVRESAMTAYEMMLSESQERMLMVLDPEKEAAARAIFDKWDLDFAVVGETIAEDRFIVRHQGAVRADLPLRALSGNAPEYDRPRAAPPAPPPLGDVPPTDAIDGLRALIGSPNHARKAWVWEQYDHTVMADTVVPPGHGAGVVRVHGTTKALAFTADVTPRYCAANPFEGGKQAVATRARFGAAGRSGDAVVRRVRGGAGMRRIGIALLYAATLTAGLLVATSAFLGLAFGLRDAFCYPRYPSELAGMFAILTLLFAGTFAPATLIAWAGLRGRPRRGPLTLSPVIAAGLALWLLWSAEAVAHWSNAAHCAAGPPERQDGSAAIPTVAHGLAWLALIAAIGAPISGAAATVGLARRPA